MRILWLLGFLLFSACADHDVPQASGEWKVLNPGQWDFNPALVTVPELPKLTGKGQGT
jgi:hypothetical protein